VLIGVAEDAETKAWVATFRKRLDELGWKVGGNLQIEERWTAGDPDRNRRFAGELLAAKPDVIFAFSSVAVAALLQESHTVSIVFTAISDPVGSGFVESLARPGQNATGFTNFVPTMAAKWLEVLKEIAPQVRRRPSLQSANRALCGRVLPASIRSRGPGIRRTGDRGRRARDGRDRSGNRRHGP
jgi:putative ABC transport system substrate-binding protein